MGGILELGKWLTECVAALNDLWGLLLIYDVLLFHQPGEQKYVSTP